MTGNNPTSVRPASPLPKFRQVEFSDISASLAGGWADFKAYPVLGMAFGAVYVLGGLIVLYIVRQLGAPWMIIPLAIGFPLLGPFTAVGLYEISRRRAAAQPITVAGVFAHVFRQHQRQFGWMAFVVLFIFWIWIYQVRLLLALFLGFKSFSSFQAFVNVIATTPEGWGFLVAGTIIGTALAVVLLAVTVISMPLLMEREVDFITAMITSVGVVINSPIPMLGFGFVVGLLTLLALLPAFLGLLVVLPVLGHATWRLYQRITVAG